SSASRAATAGHVWGDGRGARGKAGDPRHCPGRPPRSGPSAPRGPAAGRGRTEAGAGELLLATRPRADNPRAGRPFSGASRGDTSPSPPGREKKRRKGGPGATLPRPGAAPPGRGSCGGRRVRSGRGAGEAKGDPGPGPVRRRRRRAGALCPLPAPPGRPSLLPPLAVRGWCFPPPPPAAGAAASSALPAG
ncbi:collagen alpha-1(I) chain-like, partial [Oenanthe melanoleuca]|uniref:collagen alpha-1(I) chain-like n=1 Tax=Oenanthe melanoleuca TaxID=2939378 RepID=UPI0024C188C2